MAGSLAEVSTEPVRVLVVGQGYVGLQLALRAVEVGDEVTAYDIDAGKVQRLRGGRSHVSDVADVELERALASGRYRPVADAAELGEFDVALITVPTPLADGVPDLRPIRSAAERVGPLVRPGCLVVLESTTYPGTTDELLAPALEGASGLKAGVDFHVGYSPERIDPGNNEWTLVRIPKVVAGLTPGCLDAVDAFYRRLVERTVPVSSTRVAELTKLLENTFRHVNIALPIVATAVGGIAEQFVAADAVLVPPRDPAALAAALEAVVLDPCRRTELSAASRSVATRFDIRRVAETLTARYEQPPARRRARPAHRSCRLSAVTPGTCVRRRPRIGRRSSRCSTPHSGGATNLGTASCSHGSTNATRSGPRSPGWPRTPVVLSPCACSCAGSSGGVRPRCAPYEPWTRRRTRTTRVVACSRH